MKRIYCFVLFLLPFLSKAQDDSLVYRQDIDSLINRFFTSEPEPLYRFVNDVPHWKHHTRQANWFYNRYVTANGDTMVCFGLKYLAANFIDFDEQYILLNNGLVYAGSNRRTEVNTYTGVKLEQEQHLGGIEYYFRKDLLVSTRTQPYGFPPEGWTKPEYALQKFRERYEILQSWLKAHSVK